MSDERNESPEENKHPDDGTDMGEILNKPQDDLSSEPQTLHDRIKELLDPEELQHLTASDKSLRITNATLHIVQFMNVRMELLEQKLRLLAENNNVLTDRVRRFELQNARPQGESREDANVPETPDPKEE